MLVPTRELAAQVQESVRTYGKHMKLRAAVIFGGVGIKPQADELRRGVDIVVATPGRLLDHVEQKTIDLRQVEILVLDEADRMLDMGFIHDIRRILALLPAKRQNLLFSATFPDAVRKLAAGFMHDPVTVEVARRNMPIELIAQVVHPVDKDRKRELLAHLVKTNDWQQVLVFTRTKHGANRLAEQLEQDGIEATRSTATRASRSARRRSSDSRTASCRCWWLPTSRRAASTSRLCRTWSTTTCRTFRRTTCIASAAPAARANPGKRSRSSPVMTARCFAISRS